MDFSKVKQGLTATWGVLRKVSSWLWDELKEGFRIELEVSVSEDQQKS